jgi:DnaK suppressor protein
MVQADNARHVRLKNLLLEEKRRLWNELRVEIFDKLGNNINMQYDTPLDIGDRSVLDLLGDTGLAIADIRSEKLTLLENALIKLENDSYGICDDCGVEIDEERLKIFPYAACCTVCQQRREGIGKSGANF